MKFILVLCIIFTFDLASSQNEIDSYEKILSKLDKAMQLHIESPAGKAASNYFQNILPNIIDVLENRNDTTKNKILFMHWFYTHLKFSWGLNYQSILVKCKDKSCLRHHLLNYNRESRPIHKKFGLEIIEKPCDMDEMPPLVYITSIRFFKKYAEIIGDEEIIFFLNLQEKDNRLVINKEHFKCLSANQMCDLILLYEQFLELYPDSKFNSRVWYNYTDLTSMFLSATIFYEWHGHENLVFSEALAAYQKYIDNSNNVTFKQIVRIKLNQLLEIKMDYFKVKYMQYKKIFLEKIF